MKEKIFAYITFIAIPLQCISPQWNIITNIAAGSFYARSNKKEE